MIKPITTAIVIPCFHRLDNLEKYLPSIVKHASGARIIVVNNGNDPDVKQATETISGGIECLSLDGYHSRAEALNFAMSQIDADVIMTLDDDVEATGHFITPLVKACLDGAYVGISYQQDNWLTEINGQRQPYFELCHAASRETWGKIGAWPTEYAHWFTDVEMCLRARALGIPVVALDLPMIHRDGKTIDRVIERDAGVMADRAIYLKRCAQYG